MSKTKERILKYLESTKIDNRFRLILNLYRANPNYHLLTYHNEDHVRAVLNLFEVFRKMSGRGFSKDNLEAAYLAIAFHDIGHSGRPDNFVNDDGDNIGRAIASFVDWSTLYMKSKVTLMTLEERIQLHNARVDKAEQEHRESGSFDLVRWAYLDINSLQGFSRSGRWGADFTVADGHAVLDTFGAPREKSLTSPVVAKTILLIKSTEYPISRNFESITDPELQEISNMLRDADMLWGTMPGMAEQCMIGLWTERNNVGLETAPLDIFTVLRKQIKFIQNYQPQSSVGRTYKNAMFDDASVTWAEAALIYQRQIEAANVVKELSDDEVLQLATAIRKPIQEAMMGDQGAQENAPL